MTAFGGRILDATAVLDVAAGTSFYARTLLDTALSAGFTLAIPSAALARAWGNASPVGRMFIDDLVDRSVVVVDPLDTPAARTVGTLVTGRTPVERGHVVASARARGWPVITAEPVPLRALAPDVDLEPLP